MKPYQPILLSLLALTSNLFAGPGEIAFYDTTGARLSNGDTIDLGYQVVGISTNSGFLTMRNLSVDTALTDFVLTETGANPSEFTANIFLPVSLTNSLGISFTINSTPTTTGNVSATLNFASSDPDDNPFAIHLAMFGVGNVDSDGDGLNDIDEYNTHGTDPLVADSDGDGASDGAEVNLASLGFSNGSDDSAKVTLLQNNAAEFELFGASKVHNFNLGQTVCTRASNGDITLTSATHEAADSASNWNLIQSISTSYDNGTNEVEIEFTAPDSATQAYSIMVE